MPDRNRVVLETGSKKVFASALDWPGLSRSGKSDEEAIATLLTYVDRYEPVLALAGVKGIGSLLKSQDVADRIQGTGATDFGVPDKISDLEREPMTDVECDRQIAILCGCRAFFDGVAIRVSAELQKGPRGGGRDRDEIVLHTLGADCGYARRIGVKTPPGQIDTPAGLAAHRDAVAEAIRQANAAGIETSWPLRYFIRRAAWHLLDHAWEMEDKDLTGQ